MNPIETALARELTKYPIRLIYSSPADDAPAQRAPSGEAGPAGSPDAEIPATIDDRPLMRTLLQSLHFEALVNVLMKAHFAYEGWGEVSNAGPSMRATYSTPAQLAVRYASGPCRRVAENCAKALAEDQYEELVLAVEMEPERKQEHIARFVERVLETFLSHLTSGLRSQAEWAQYQKMEARHERNRV